jgi:hypothetical protein
MGLDLWCKLWNIPPEAVASLHDLMGMGTLYRALPSGDGEAMVQSKARLACAQQGFPVWRNNSGVLKNPDTGRPVRFGLGNDSKKINAAIKSSDLIGLRPIVIQPNMIGHTLGQFVAYEAKPAGWKYTATPREIAQLKFIEIVTAHGGHAKFLTGEDQI